MKNEEFSSGIVDHDGGDHFGNVRPGGTEAEDADKHPSGQCGQNEADDRHRIKKKQFVVPFMFSRFEDEQDVEDVGAEIGNHKAENAVDDEVAGAKGFGDRLGGKVEQFDKNIVLSQCRKGEPRQQEKADDVNTRGDSAADAVFKELNDAVVFFLKEGIDVCFHKR